MATLIEDRRAVLLIIATLVMAMVSTLTGLYLSTLVNEKRSVDDTRLTVQAMNLGNAGVNHAMAELRKRIAVDLAAKVENISTNAIFTAYAADPLGLLNNLTYINASNQFALNANHTQATLILPSVYTLTGTEGNYGNTTIKVTKANTTSSDTVADVYKFYYTFTVESTGNVTRYAVPIQKRVIYAPTNIEIDFRRDNFAKYALFTTLHYTTDNKVVWFTNNTNFQGPVHTNTRFAFSGNPSAHFTDEASQYRSNVTFDNNGHNITILNDHNNSTDVPIFDKGLTRGAENITLSSTLNQTQMKAQVLGSMTEPGTNGVWVANDGTHCVGGIYIKGGTGSSDNANITMSVDGSSRQVYVIRQSSTTKTIAVDAANNRTTVTAGSNITNYTGIPDGVRHEGILIYSNDDIGRFNGTVQSGTKAIISSAKNITIVGNVTYDSYSSSPLSAEGSDNLLGILAWTGNVTISTDAPDNLQVHGVVMAPQGVFQVACYNCSAYGDRGVVTLLGGMITQNYGTFGTFSDHDGDTGYGRNFVYDTRMGEGMAPPYFPYMKNFTSILVPDDVLRQKPAWQEKDIP